MKKGAFITAALLAQIQAGGSPKKTATDESGAKNDSSDTRNYNDVPEKGMYWQKLPNGLEIIMSADGVPQEVIDRLAENKEENVGKIITEIMNRELEPPVEFEDQYWDPATNQLTNPTGVPASEHADRDPAKIEDRIKHLEE